MRNILKSKLGTTCGWCLSWIFAMYVHFLINAGAPKVILHVYTKYIDVSQTEWPTPSSIVP